MKRLGTCNSYQAELWGIYTGLNLAWKYGLRKLVVESDNLAIINQLNNSLNLSIHRTKLRADLEASIA